MYPCQSQSFNYSSVYSISWTFSINPFNPFDQLITHPSIPINLSNHFPIHLATSICFIIHLSIPLSSIHQSRYPTTSSINSSNPPTHSFSYPSIHPTHQYPSILFISPSTLFHIHPSMPFIYLYQQPSIHPIHLHIHSHSYKFIYPFQRTSSTSLTNPSN